MKCAGVIPGEVVTLESCGSPGLKLLALEGSLRFSRGRRGSAGSGH